MRARMAGIFIMGFAMGVLVLAVVLWRSGTLGTSAVLAGSRPPLPCAAASPAPVIVTPPPAVTPPDDRGEPAPSEAPAKPARLAMPIAGLDADRLRDTFADMREGRKHEALDIMAPRGTPVRAVDEGNVVKLFHSKPGGITVYQFDDAGAYCYYYAHLDRYAPGLKEGTLLRRGDVLGYVGSTGNASPAAPHLHFAVNRLGPDKKWWEGTPIDPLPLLR